MGIRGLFTLIANNEKAYQIRDLVKVAEIKKGIEILVDFHAFQRDLCEIISRKMEMEYDNPYLLFLSGEYDIFTEAFSEFHKIFEEIGIKLVWIIDGPKGVDEIASAQKTETWIKRDKQDIAQLKNVLDGCKTKTPPKDLNNLGPLLGFEVAIASLKNAGAEIIQLLQGGSDELIVSEFIKRKSYAIITGDTDFLVFNDCKVIFPRLMTTKYEDNLHLPFIDTENPGKIFKKPESFFCPIVSQPEIFQLFNLSSHDQLIALSIIKGNDNTEEYAQKLQYYLKITKNETKNAHVTQVANYISKNKVTPENICRLPGMDRFLDEFPQIKDSITFCFNFYTLKHYNENKKNSLVTFDPTVASDSLTDFFREKLSRSEISKKIYSAHRGIFYDAIIMEKPNAACPSNSSIMKEIRSRIYQYVLDENLHEVNEWRFRDSPEVFKIQINHHVFKTNQIKGKPDSASNCDSDDSVIYGIDLFEETWSHLEQKKSLNYVKLFGLEKGFICYILRYFYKITKDKNIKVTVDEFRALFVTVFYQYGISQEIKFKTTLKRDMFLGMKICPTEKCLIIYSWFMNIYFTGKYLSGGTFNLTEDFPSPVQVMSASVLYAFYENIMNDMNQRILHLDDSIQESILCLEKQILEQYSEEYAVVTQ